MQAFAQLIQTLSQTASIVAKRDALVQYVEQAEEADVLWVIALFTGRRPRRLVPTAVLREACLEITGYPAWLFDESYQTVGDLAETIALLLPPLDDTSQTDELQSTSLAATITTLEALQASNDEEKKAYIQQQWKILGPNERFVFHKLLTGGFRIGVSQLLLVQALAAWTKIEAPVIAHRMSGNWHPTQTTLRQLLHRSESERDPAQPYPFYLAHALDMALNELGAIQDWQAEWKWDGIRGQIIVRANQRFVWSRGEELMTDKFPELEKLEQCWPDGTVLDGEILCVTPDETGGFQPLPFHRLQTRIGRKTITRKQLTEAPVGFVAYDLLEWQGEDWRAKPLVERRQQLMHILQAYPHPAIWISPTLTAATWDELALQRAQARQNGSEGLMLKHNQSVYGTGRKKGDWWKWKMDPWHIDAVLIYAQKGHGRRSNLFTDYTFALRDGNQFIPFTKAYSGLTDAEFTEVDRFIKQNVIEKFGPVRTVQPTLVFEIAFEGIARSNRHKSGVALRFPRMARWRRDKTVADINTLDDLHALLKQAEQQGLTNDIQIITDEKDIL